MSAEPEVVDDVPPVETINRGGRPPKVGWERKYLKYVRKYGTKIKAARAAAVSYRTVVRRANANPAFAQAIDHALEWYADTCEERLVATSDKGNPVGLIVRLKALRPDRYIEKHAVMNINANVSVEGADGVALLRQMLGQATPSTMRAIVETTGEHIDAELRDASGEPT